MAINKVIYGGNTLIDLTGDTITANDLLSGKTAHDKSGATITGACTYDSDTSEDTVAVAEILIGKTAHARATQLTGTMPNNGSVTGTISTKNGSYTIPQGYHDGSGNVAISSTEKSKIIATNIKSGVSILGVTGSYSGESVTAQTKTVTPSTTAQTVTPDTGYDYLSEVTVNAISYVETDNSAGGKTVTIAG
jgi:hypothetical protein